VVSTADPSVPVAGRSGRAGVVLVDPGVDGRSTDGRAGTSDVGCYVFSETTTADILAASSSGEMT
jgi:hypothetical protein